MNAVKIYKLAYGKEPKEFYNLGMLQSDIVFDENDNQDLFTSAIPKYVMTLLRQQRNQLLAQSDWMAVSDRTMTPEQIAYRQALRDMPANNPDVALNEAGELINVTWPTEPQ